MITSSQKEVVKVFLAGDVMTGCGVDQILPNPCDPRIHEPMVKSANEYVQMAEQAHGPMTRPVDFEYIWGAALDELQLSKPDVFVANLETAITHSENFLTKGINYRMSPENAECLAAAGINGCVLANNHILDWGEAGLIDTVATLEKLKIKSVGAGRDLICAQTPAAFDVGQDRRVIVFAVASETSGTPKSWAAGKSAAGVNVLGELSDASASKIARQVTETRQPGDIVIVSIHWGANWGYYISQEQVRFAHQLIDEANVSAVFGHSSHHAKAIELYRNRPVLYGCGDFLNDYEGITKHRGDLVLLYAAIFDSASVELHELELVPFQIRRFQLIRPSKDDLAWLQQTLDRESRAFGTTVRLRHGRLFAEPFDAIAQKHAICLQSVAKRSRRANLEHTIPMAEPDRFYR